MIDTVATKPLRDRTALVAGLGNIGSSLGGLLLQSGIGELRLVDRDRVEVKNLSAQDYLPVDVGRSKAESLADRLRQRFPDRIVRAWSLDLEDLPVGVADVSLIFGGLDSRRARQILVGDLAWPLGVPVVDGGVGDNHLGRVQVFVPGPSSAVLECTWSAADYRLASQEYPCQAGANALSAPTAAPAYLGQFTASLMVREAARYWSNEDIDSYEIPFDLDNLIVRRFALRRAQRCRHDHAILSECLCIGTTVAELIDRLRERFGSNPVSLQVRRDLGRFMSLEGLHQKRTKSLAEVGFLPEDRVRVRCQDSSIWMRVSRQENGDGNA